MYVYKLKKITIMKKIYFKYALPLLSAMICAGCNVDQSYDLSNINNDNIGIGTDESTFDMPLVTVTLDISSLLGSGGEVMSAPTGRADYGSLSVSDVLDMVNDITSFLPSVLDGEYAGGINLDQLSDETYVKGLVDLLFDEMTTDSQKRLALCEYILEEVTTDYADVLDGILTDDIATYTAQECADELGDVLNDSDYADDIVTLKASIVDEIIVCSADLVTDYSMTEDLGSIDVDSSALDILSSNLEGESNYIQLFAEVTTNLPLTVTITPKLILSDSSELILASLSDLESGSELGIIDSIEQLEIILASLVISADITINYFDPSAGSLDLTDKYLQIKLVVRKGGSFTL